MEGSAVEAGEEERAVVESGGMKSVESVFPFPKGKAAKTFFALVGIWMLNFEVGADSVGTEGVVGAGVGVGYGGIEGNGREVEVGRVRED